MTYSRCFLRAAILALFFAAFFHLTESLATQSADENSKKGQPSPEPQVPPFPPPLGPEFYDDENPAAAKAIAVTKKIEEETVEKQVVQDKTVASGVSNFNIGRCGDGIKAASEECDDGNLISGDGCSAACQMEWPVCGNGKLEAGEPCDDGNNRSGDGCSAGCLIERCGDGTLQPNLGEACEFDGDCTGDQACVGCACIDCPAAANTCSRNSQCPEGPHELRGNACVARQALCGPSVSNCPGTQTCGLGEETQIPWDNTQQGTVSGSASTPQGCLVSCDYTIQRCGGSVTPPFFFNKRFTGGEFVNSQMPGCGWNCVTGEPLSGCVDVAAIQMDPTSIVCPEPPPLAANPASTPAPAAPELVPTKPLLTVPPSFLPEPAPFSSPIAASLPAGNESASAAEQVSASSKIVISPQSVESRSSFSESSESVFPSPTASPFIQNLSSTSFPGQGATTGSAAICGNGEVETGEQCDPPEKSNQCAQGSFCNESCQCAQPVCGNQIAELGETCGEPGLAQCPGGSQCDRCVCRTPCLDEAQCDDHNPCTIDRCAAGFCKSVLKCPTGNCNPENGTCGPCNALWDCSRSKECSRNADGSCTECVADVCLEATCVKASWNEVCRPCPCPDPEKPMSE